MTSLSQLIRDVGSVLSGREAQRIANQTGKTLAQVLAKADKVGVGIGSGAIRRLNNAPATPARTQNQIAAQQAVAPLMGLTIGKGNVYHGSTSTTTPATTTRSMGGGVTSRPATTTYTPIVTPRTRRPSVQTQPASADTAAGGETAPAGSTEPAPQEFDYASMFGDMMSMMPDYGAMFGGLQSQMAGMFDELSSRFDVTDPIQLAALGQAYGGDLIRARQRQRKTRTDYLRNRMNNMALGGTQALAPMMIGGGLTL